MGKKILATTEKDYSAEYFAKHGWEVVLYASDDLPEAEADYLYFRDPFNDASVAGADWLERRIWTIAQKYSAARLVDGVSSLSEMTEIEDKWGQAQRYGGLGPRTWLATETEFVTGEHLAKPRISQRAKDILLELDREIDEKWIIQELLDISEELRAYVVFGQVAPVATIKSSKTSGGKVKVIGGRELFPDEIEFLSRVAAMSGLDFIGVDLVRLRDGSLRMIEVNRSPQFNRFVEMYGEELLAGILDL